MIENTRSGMKIVRVLTNLVTLCWTRLTFDQLAWPYIATFRSYITNL